MEKTDQSRFIRNITLSLILFIALCLLFLFVGHSGSFKTESSVKPEPLPVFTENVFTTVVIDPGHGGYDSGTRSDSEILEKDLNLTISKKIAEYLSCFDINVVLTRNDDTAPSGVDGQSRKRSEILSRIKIADEENADLFLSVHMNYFPDASCRGTQVFFTENNLKNQVFAHTLQATVQKLVQPENARAPKSGDSIFLLQNLKIPSALIECGFLSNSEETALLCEESYQNKLAFAIASAIVTHLQETQH